jgi:hypothetical protein
MQAFDLLKMAESSRDLGEKNVFCRVPGCRARFSEPGRKGRRKEGA